MCLIKAFRWNKSFEIGIPLIDEQHKMLAELLNVVTNHLTHQSDLSTMRYVFHELLEYTTYHFLTEEAIWHEFFPEDAWKTIHNDDHNKFLDKIKALMDEQDARPSTQMLEELHSFLSQWLTFHIMDTDMRMSKVVFAVLSGTPLNQAKEQVDQEMNMALNMQHETTQSSE
jgi:hemerythrin-like metal-binding domain